MPSFQDFKLSPIGQAVGAILSDHDMRVELICLAKHGLPPAQAAGAEILKQVGSLNDTQKQHVGRWIRDILAESGWEPTTKGARVSPGNMFSRASLYGRSDAEGQQ